MTLSWDRMRRDKRLIREAQTAGGAGQDMVWRDWASASGLWQGGLGRDDQCGWGGRQGMGHSGRRRAGAAWVVWDGEKWNGTGQARQAGQTASGRGKAAT